MQFDNVMVKKIDSVWWNIWSDLSIHIDYRIYNVILENSYIIETRIKLTFIIVLILFYF